jgi:DNA-binding response OmpR family regulator
VEVLLVEDDIRFAAVLITELRRFGYVVNHATTAAEALAAPPCDLVLLDLGLPDGNGFGLCRRLRRDSDVPIIVLTARSAERDRVAGLRGGADDYLVKPFGVAELRARVEAVMRRARRGPAGALTVGGVRIDLDRHQVFIADAPVQLTRKEFRLLVALAATPDSVVPRDRLITQVWQTSWHGASRTLDVHIAALRAKLGDALRLETVRGVGYRLVGSQAANS